MARRIPLTQLLYDLQLGQSWVVEGHKPETIRTTAWRLGKSEGRKYECRSTPDGYQVWRTA